MKIKTTKVFMPKATIKCPCCFKDYKIDVRKVIVETDIDCQRCGEKIHVIPVYDSFCVLTEQR